MKYCQVVGRILCFLRKPCKDFFSTTNRIVDKCCEELSRWCIEGGNCILKLTNNGLIDVRYDNGIVLYFHFTNREELLQTKRIFEAGQMKTMAEADFRSLLAIDRISVVVKWPAVDLKRCDNHLLQRPFSCTNIHECPMEVLEMILSKAFALYFDVSPPHPSEKKLFAMLSSVSSDWLQTMARRRFKSSVQKYISPFVHMINKRNTIIINNRRYLVESMQPTENLITRMLQYGCLTVEEADYIASLHCKYEKNHELLNIVRTMSFKKHFAFIESLQFCGQRNVAHVTEKGGVVVMAKMIHSKVTNSTEFVKLVNEKISELNANHSEHLNGLLVLDKEDTLEVLEIKHLGRVKGNDRSVIYLWCKSQKSLQNLRELLDSDQLLKRFEILISCLNSEEKSSLYNLHDYYKPESPQFIKRLTIDTIQLQKGVVVRQMSLMHSETFDLPRSIKAVTSLDDKIFILLRNMVSIHEDVSPFARVSKCFFPPQQLESSFSPRDVNYRHVMVTCDDTKCIYITRDKDSRLWKLTTPDYQLKVWMADIGQPFSMYVARNGNVALMKQGGESHVGMYCLDIYSKDAALMQQVLIPSVVPIEPSWAMEMLPGKLFLKIDENLAVREVNFSTLTADPDMILFPKSRRRWRDRKFAGITSYCEGQILVLLSKNLALFDSQLNVDIIPTSTPIDAGSVYFKKEKRQLMFWSKDTIEINIIGYKAEDMFADDQ